jgi:hypothetical protein
VISSLLYVGAKVMKISRDKTMKSMGGTKLRIEYLVRKSQIRTNNITSKSYGAVSTNFRGT